MNLTRLLDAMTEKLGGSTKLRLPASIRFAGDVELGEFKGTFDTLEDRTSFREFSRADLGVIRFANGFDGAMLWSVDPNGKIDKTADRERLAEHGVLKRFAAYRYLTDRDAYQFDLQQGEDGLLVLMIAEKAYGDEPYGRISVTVDPKTALIVAQEETRGGGRMRTEIVAYQEFSGLLLPSESMSTDPAGNITRTHVRTVEMDPEVDESVYAVPARDVRDFRFLHGGTSSVIPLHIPLYHVYADVRIGDRDYRFAVDTGAGKTVVGTDVAEELGLEQLGSIMGMGVSGPQSFMLVNVPEMIVGDVALADQHVIAIDLTEVRKGLPELSGLLGMDFLNRFVVKFDYVKKEMEVFERDAFQYRGQGETIHIDGIACPMAVEGVGGRFTVDTGAGAIDLHTPFVRKHGLLRQPALTPSAATVAGVGSLELRSYRVLCREFCIGGFTLHDIPMGLADVESGAFSNEITIGNVGGMIWGRFITYFDFSEGRMILEPNVNIDDPFLIPRFGMGFKMIDGCCMVDTVLSNSPAARHEFRRGDELVDIGGRRAASMTLEDIHILLCGPEGTSIPATFRRASGEEIALDIRLENFLHYYDHYAATGKPTGGLEHMESR